MSRERGCFISGVPFGEGYWPWDDTIAQRIIKRAAVPLAGRLEMGRFHKLLPRNVANSAVLNLLNLETFQQKYREATLVEMPGVEEQLTSLTH
jgi:hypothetical protein